MMHDLDSVPIKQLSSRQLKKIYKANEKFTPYGSRYADTPLMAAIKLELEDRQFTQKLRGEGLNPWLKWGLISGGIVVGLLLALNLFYNPSQLVPRNAVGCAKSDLKSDLYRPENVVERVN